MTPSDRTQIMLPESVTFHSYSMHGPISQSRVSHSGSGQAFPTLRGGGRRTVLERVWYPTWKCKQFKISVLKESTWIIWMALLLTNFILFTIAMASWPLTPLGQLTIVIAGYETVLPGTWMFTQWRAEYIVHWFEIIFAYTCYISVCDTMSTRASLKIINILTISHRSYQVKIFIIHYLVLNIVFFVWSFKIIQIFFSCVK